jgi:ADP-dependent NAD(P)H-hydrate dehydratase / NAD(P)H-hydrate epimerase
MRPVITPEEAARLDAASTVPVDDLMERAGLAVALAAVEMGARYGTRVTVLAGPGNNGGDGYVAARHLRGRGVAVEVHALDHPRTEVAHAAAARARRAGVPVRELAGPVPSAIVIDALFGGGFRRGLPDEVRSWMAVPARVLAVDVPSGLDPATGEVADGAFSAERTVTFHALKTGHVQGEGPDRCGLVTVADIGLVGGDPAMVVADDGDAPRPPRPRAAHKWSAGSVLVVGGSPGMLGAAVLAGTSALTFGAGSTAVAVPGAWQQALVAAAPQLLSHAVGGGFEFPAGAGVEVCRLAERYDVTLLGPGLGRGRPELVAETIRGVHGPLVLDADALNLLDPAMLESRSVPAVLTPHAGEFRRLTGEEPGPDAARGFASASGSVVLLKGNPTHVTDGETVWLVDAGGPELATIGTGDVLAGMLAALWARGLEPLTAAVSAAHWHGRAGADLASAGTVTADRLAEHVARFAWDRP